MPSISQTKTTTVTSGAVESAEAKTYYTYKMFNTCTFEETSIDVFPGECYRIIFYDSDSQKLADVTGKVTYAGSSNIILESITAINDCVCLCEHRQYLNNVINVYIVNIPTANIYSITKVEEKKDDEKPLPPPRPKERDVVVVGILGLSAEIVRSVVVRLRVYDDDKAPTYEATPVDMKVGNTYNVTYFSRRDRSMYEIVGKLENIEVMPIFKGDTKLNGFVRDEVSGNTDVVGMNNTIYNADHFMDLKKESPEGERVRFTFDTSEDFLGHHDFVWLKDIRGVELVSEGEDSGDDEGQDVTPGGDDDKPVPPPPPEPFPDGDYDHHSHWGPPLDPPPPPRDEDIWKYKCPINLSPVQMCDCSECEQVNTCVAFEEYCNQDNDRPIPPPPPPHHHHHHH